MTWFVILLGGLFLFVAGQSVGYRGAEAHAVQHSDCATAHHMRGGFYYIVPEKEYVELILLRHRKSSGSDLPIKQMKMEAGWALACKERGCLPLDEEYVGDLACHVLALAEALEKAEGATRS